MTTRAHEYKSRWGFHPCSYEQHLKLKFLHKCYWQTVYDFHRWHRWWRKQEQNRTGPEPTYCQVFVADKTWYKRVQVHGEPGFMIYPKMVVDHGILALHQAARTPQEERVPLWDSATAQEVEQLYERVRSDLEK